MKRILCNNLSHIYNWEDELNTLISKSGKNRETFKKFYKQITEKNPR